MTARTMSYVFIILGMHRSGTSLAASIFHAIGISMGSRLLKADELNPYGYFEDLDFLELNKSILLDAKGTWFNPPNAIDLQTSGKKFRGEIQTILTDKRRKAGRNHWGWKDPRTCLTIRSYIPEIQQTKLVVVVRNPSDIKKSLEKAHGDIADWDRLIDRYYREIESFVQSSRSQCLVLSFEELAFKKYSDQTMSKILAFTDRSERYRARALKNIHFK